MIRSFEEGKTYRLSIDLAEFYFLVLNGSKPKGRTLVREMIFKPTSRVRYRDGVIWTGKGIVDGEPVAGIVSEQGA